MKIKYILPIAFAIAASSAHAAYYPYYESKTTFKMTYTYRGDYTQKTTEGSSQYSYEYPKVVEKIGNKELLEALLEDAEVDMGGTIKGWSIVTISNGYDPDDVYIVKKDESPINVSDYIYIRSVYDGPYQETYGGIENQGEEEFDSYTSEYIGIGAVEINFDDLDFASEPTGTLSSGYKYDSKISDDYYFFLGCSITGLAGVVDIGDEYGFVGGSVSASAGVETDVYDEM